MRYLSLSILSAVVLSMSALAEVGDPGFEKTAPGELPLWSGALWAKQTEAKHTATVVENEAQAHGGKHFLRVQNPLATSAHFVSYPSQKCVPGYGFKVTAWFRGNAKVCIGLTPYDAKGKYKPWKQAHCTEFKNLTEGKWESVTYTYKPEEDENTVMFTFTVRDGLAELDDYIVELVELSQKEARTVQSRPAPKVSAVKAASTDSAWKPEGCGRYVSTDFEQWEGCMPAGWALDDGDTASVVRCYKNPESERSRFGTHSMFLNGKVIMKPQLVGLSDRRGRPVIASFYARGENGHVVAKLREGVDGKTTDFLCELVEEDTGAEWKKYAIQLSTHPSAGIDNIGLELTGSNVLIDNAMVGTVTGSDGALKYSVPVVSAVPEVDGVNAPGEWAVAMGGSEPFQLALGMSAGTKPNTPALLRQASVRMCSDGKSLFFLVEMPNAANLIADAKKRDGNVFCDDCLEFHLNPELGNKSPRYSYQFVFNSKGVLFDQRRELGSLNPEYVKWNSVSLKYVSHVVDDVWILEGCVDLAELGLEMNKPFGMNWCMTRHNPEANGSLNGGDFLDSSTMVETVVTQTQPCFYWNRNGDWGSQMVTVSNPGTKDGNYNLTLKLNAEKASEEIVRKVHLPAGGSSTALLNVPGGAGAFGSFILELSSPEGKIFARQTMDFNLTLPLQKKAERPLGFYLLPEQRKYALNVFLDSNKFDAMEMVAVNGLAEKELLFRRSDFTKFEKTLALKRDFVPEDGRRYSVNVAALDKDGVVLDAVTTTFTGDSSLIPKPNPKDRKGILLSYTPIRVDGRSVKVNLRTYQFGGNALPEALTTQGVSALDAPVSLTAELEDGTVLTGKSGKFELKNASDEEITFAGETLFPGFTVRLTGRMEYDGAIFYHAAVNAPRPVKVKRLSLEIPFKRLDYLHSFIDSQLRLWMCRQPAQGEYRHPSVEVWTPKSILVSQNYRQFSLFFFPAGDGLLFSSRNVVPGVIKNGFLPYMTFGNHQYGMEVFADCDRGWVHARKASVYEAWRKNGKEFVRVNFIAVPWTLSDTREFEFGLLATPARLAGRDARFNRIHIIGYSHTGLTDQTLCGLRAKDWNLLANQHQRSKDHGNIPTYLCCKGHFPQTDPVAQYMDSEWRSRPDYSFSDCKAWLPTRQFGTDIRNYINPSGCFTPGRLDFYGERFREIISRLPAMGAVYWDENWNKPCNNPNHAECGYLLPDGQLQGRSWWTGVREVDRRVRHLFAEYGRKDGIIKGFTGEGIIPHAYSFADYNLFGEHPTYDMDFIDYWTPHFMEIAGAGAWGFGKGFFGMFRDPKYLPRKDMHRAQLALVKLYNVNFSWNDFNYEFYRPCHQAEKRFRLHDPDIQFAGYFTREGQEAVPGLPCTVKASLYVRPGKGALIYIGNLGEKTFQQAVRLNLKRWNISNYTALNAEEGTPVSLDNVTIGRHDFLMLEIRAK